MTWVIRDTLIAPQPIATTETGATARHPLGTIVTAVDPTYGEGEFIYLIGVASTIVGSLVSYDDGDTLAFQTALYTSVVGNPDPFAVAMSANLAGDFGWYQIGGIAACGKANTLSLAPGENVAIATGLVIAEATSNVVGGLVTCITASASTLVITVPCMINRPHGPRGT